MNVEKFLDEKNTFAIVGASRNKEKPSHKLLLLMKNAGIKVYAVNPNCNEIAGIKCYRSLLELPEKPDVVITFTKPEITEKIIEECAKLGIKRIWMQPGSESKIAIEKAKKLGLEIVANTCFIMQKFEWEDFLWDAVKKELSSASHDFEHVKRVYKLCLEIAKHEKNVNFRILKAAAILHDIARVREDKDISGKTDHAKLGAEMAEKLLKHAGFSKEEIEAIKHCILAHRFRNDVKPESIEAKILFDADKLDAIGAVGIGRSFMIAGEYGSKLYANISLEEYIKENLVGGKPGGRIKDISKHAPNLEYELKLKHIPEKLYTSYAKKLANKRAAFMEKFFKRLKKEIGGKA